MGRYTIRGNARAGSLKENDMNIRFYNARILTMADGCRMETGEVWVEGNRISYAGPSRPAGCCPAMPEGQKQEKKWDREIDAL